MTNHLLQIAISYGAYIAGCDEIRSAAILNDLRRSGPEEQSYVDWNSSERLFEGSPRRWSAFARALSDEVTLGERWLEEQGASRLDPMQWTDQMDTVARAIRTLKAIEVKIRKTLDDRDL